MAVPSAPARPVDRVALVGLPGSGKSAVGAALARRRGWRLDDVDGEVERAAGVSIAELFDAEGEEGFRRREAAALREVLDRPAPAVVVCGGGLVTREAARALLLRSSLVVWLDAPDEVLLRRLGDARARPLLRSDPRSRLRALREERGGAYATAHLRVDASDGDVEDVCDRVEDAVSGVRLHLRDEARPAPLHVDLGDRSYPVVVGRGALDGLAAHLPPASTRVAVVADRAVLAHAGRAAAAVRASGRRATVVPVAGGEPLKTWAAAGRLVTRLAALGLDRDDCLVAVGGGTVGDLAGFAAATYLRGIACIQAPTTLLAMVDSGIGGKTGVNLAQGKNLAGAFWQPAAVLCDLDVLGTLPDRPWRAAFAEIVKYPMVADAGLSSLLDDRLDALLDRDLDALVPLVERCCAVKAEVVAGDEREGGRRAILNYGHTVGHALEALTHYGDALLHGEAVACGMRVAGALSVALRGCPAGDVAWQDEMLDRCGLVSVPQVSAEAVLAATAGDKKARAGSVRWVLLDRRGAAGYGHTVPDEAALQALRRVLPS